MLGPLLFILYINDIIGFCKIDLIINLFPDDMIISVEGPIVVEVIIKMQNILSMLEQWLNVNYMFVNTKKKQ